MTQLANENILAFDTSTECASVAILAGDVVRAEVSGHVRARYGETLLPYIEDALQRAGLQVSDLGLLAVGLGPGSYTGLRVGVATAKGLGLGGGIPVVGVCSSRVLSRRAAHAWPGMVGIVTDAFQGEVYVSLHDEKGVSVAPRVMKPEAAAAEFNSLSPLRVLGSGIRRYSEIFAAFEQLPAEFDIPSAIALAELGEIEFEQTGASDLRMIEPNYARG